MSKYTKSLFDELSNLYQKLPPRRVVNSLLRKTTDFIPRKVKFNDKKAEFYGGPMRKLFVAGYEKGLKNLWKSELVAPYLGIKDASREEKQRLQEAHNLSVKETVERVSVITSEEFKTRLDTELDQVQRQSLARIMSVLCTGEVYAMAVSASLINDLKGTSTQLFLGTQVVEECKHFYSLRELIKIIDRYYPQTFWDFILFETIIRAKPVNRLFGMNAVLETVALQLFSMFSQFDSLEEIMYFFHMDEARHTALPHNYAEEGGLTFLDKHNPVTQIQRLAMILPLIGLLFELEEDAKVLGIDIFEFGGRVITSLFRLSERSGYYLPINRFDIMRLYNLSIALYKRLGEPDKFQGVVDLTQEKTLKVSDKVREVEHKIFSVEDNLPGVFNNMLEPGKRYVYLFLKGILDSSI